MEYGIAYAVMTCNVNRSMVSRWEKKWSKYQVDPNAQAPPSESTPTRPLAEILDCKPEECNEAENMAIFAYHSHRDVDTFNTRDEYEADAIREVDDEKRQKTASLMKTNTGNKYLTALWSPKVNWIDSILLNTLIWPSTRISLSISKVMLREV